MGYYYERPPEEEKPPGCLDALLITRAVLSIVIIPVLAMIAVVVALSIALWLFAVHPALALIPVALMLGGIVLFARWEQSRTRPPDL